MIDLNQEDNVKDNNIHNKAIISAYLKGMVDPDISDSMYLSYEMSLGILYGHIYRNDKSDWQRISMYCGKIRKLRKAKPDDWRTYLANQIESKHGADKENLRNILNYILLPDKYIDLP